MKPARGVGWGDLVMGILTGVVLRRLTNGPDIPPTNPPERFCEQPRAVYLERIVWALTRDFDIARIRAVRNFVAEHDVALAEGHRLEIAPEQMARRVERAMSGDLAALEVQAVPGTPQSSSRSTRFDEATEARMQSILSGASSSTKTLPEGDGSE